jgi:hypothetical protein
LSIFSRLDEWTTLAAIAMPDHLHTLVAPLDRDASVAAFSKLFKRWFDEEYCTNHCRPSVSDGTPVRKTWKWQEGCFDRLLRSDESLSDRWEYLRQNPVRAGWSRILKTGHSSSRRPATNCRASVSDANSLGWRFTAVTQRESARPGFQTPYKKSNPQSP